MNKKDYSEQIGLQLTKRTTLIKKGLQSLKRLQKGGLLSKDSKRRIVVKKITKKNYKKSYRHQKGLQ